MPQFETWVATRRVVVNGAIVEPGTPFTVVAASYTAPQIVTVAHPDPAKQKTAAIATKLSGPA